MKDAYPFDCCACGHSQMARPSISMQMGRNSGFGKCGACGAILHLEIAPDLDGEGMKSELHAEWVERELERLS